MLSYMLFWVELLGNALLYWDYLQYVTIVQLQNFNTCYSSVTGLFEIEMPWGSG